MEEFVIKKEPLKIFCETCGVLVEKNKYQRHIQNGHKDKKEYKCEICSKVLTSCYNLKYHIAHHLNERNFHCTLCPNAYNTKADLSQHLIRQHGMKTAQPKHSTKVTDSEDSDNKKTIKRRHVRAKDPIYNAEVTNSEGSDDKKTVKRKRVRSKCIVMPKTCNICGSEVKDLRRHYEGVHMDVKNFECSICHKGFYKKFDIKRHIEMVHSETKKYDCQSCGRAFGSRSNLSTHIPTCNPHRKTFCKACKKKVPKIEEHYETVHADLLFPCKECFRRYGTQSELDKHITSNHVRKHFCEGCAKGFVKLRDLKRHHLRFKSHTTQSDLPNPPNETKNYECDFCGRSYMIKDMLAKHVVICKPRFITCEQCFRRFETKTALDKHINSNHVRKHFEVKHLRRYQLRFESHAAGNISQDPLDNPKVKDHKCETCEESFKTREMLAAHRNNCTSRLFTCDACKERVPNIQAHYEIHHKDILYSCDICHQSFDNQYELDNHCKLRHTRDLDTQETVKKATLKTRSQKGK